MKLPWYWFYSSRWYCTHPHLFLRDLWFNLKMAYQRVTRGWDDTFVWGLDSTLCRLLVPILEELKSKKRGVPGYLMGDKTLEEASVCFDSDLEEIIEGFRAGDRMINGISPVVNTVMDIWRERYPEEQNILEAPNLEKLYVKYDVIRKDREWYREQEKLFHRGMILFHRHFLSLNT